MRKRAVCVLLLLAVLVAGCAGMQVKDPAKAALYTAKSEWMAVREYVIRESYAVPPRVSDAQVADFKRMDDRFLLFYNVALTAYLGGIDNQAAFGKDIDELRALLLEARRKFYPGGKT